MVAPPKRCIDCGDWKPVEDFYVKRKKLVGVQRYPRCKICYNRWTYRKHGKEYAKGLVAREKELARDALKKAVRHGRIIKPDHCEECLKPTRKQDLQGHHADYTKPFEVEWLCRSCHDAEGNAEVTGG